MDLHGDRLTLTDVRSGDIPELIRIRDTPQVHRWWGGDDAGADWPLDDPAAVCLGIALAGRVIGLIQYSEETTPKYRHAGIDVFVDPELHGRGLGREAVWVLAGHLLGTLRHHRLVIDPAVDNTAAIRCYTAVGFRPVGVMRQYERDADCAGWHDGLLMDLLAGDLPPNPNLTRNAPAP